MDKLIIAEKPSVALRIALSLGDASPKRNAINGVVYYEIERGDERIYIVAAAGHLFTIHQKQKDAQLPVFEIEWIESYKVNEGAYFTKKYLDTIKEISKRCNFIINACDYDIEGTVIGSNIIKYILNGDVNSEIKSTSIGRMKFSTTTRPDLVAAYGSLHEFDFNNMHAGEARHTLDWMWGINMSRALMHAIYSTGTKKVLSIGRVQGPTLSILAHRENEIKSFKPTAYWKVFAILSGIEFENTKGSIQSEEEAKAILERTKSGKCATPTIWM